MGMRLGPGMKALDIRAGAQTSMARPVNPLANSAGATPTTANGWRLMRTLLPTIPGSDA